MKYFFNYWEKEKKNFQGQNILFLLDFDGTLATIAKKPDKALLRPRVKEILRQLAALRQCKLVIISGRTLNDIRTKVGLHNISYAGNHGFQIQGAKLPYDFKQMKSYRKDVKSLVARLKKSFKDIHGLIIEDKTFTLALHYREVLKRKIPLVRAVFNEIVKPYCLKKQIRIYKGKKVFEVRPPIEWNKGKVALWYLNNMKFPCEKNRILPLYIGDDTTDEDAFLALRKRGITVVVGKHVKSAARCYVNNPSEVATLLSEAAIFLKGNNNAGID